MSSPIMFDSRGLVRPIVIVVLLAASVTASVVAVRSRSARETEGPSISGVRAHLFQNKSAELSADLLDPKHTGSWNSVAGPNAANATLVVVEVSGRPGGTYTGYFGPKTAYRVRLKATEGGRAPKVLVDQSQVIPVLNDQGKVYLAFLIHQDGCLPVTLAVTLVGPQPSDPVERSLNFACGE